MNRVASALLGILLIIVGLVAAAEAGTAWTGRAPLILPLREWYQRLTTTPLSSRVVLLAAIATALAGLVILAGQLRHWRPKELDLPSEGAVTWRVQRRTVQQQVAAAVARVNGVGLPRVDVRGRRSAWSVSVAADARADCDPEVTRAARRAMSRLGASDDVALHVALRQPRRVT
ncbi:hypothetical protein [Catellatospora sichuanensis]|uniref:hypothetical protein n=1 Tax=Catellatospora sichuanensis TaxID=1969805 RepID=UPI00118275B6|nr:hypothetical protein [Catellatospora sichuanensis]